MKKLFFSGIVPALLIMTNLTTCFGQDANRKRLPVGQKTPDLLPLPLRQQNPWLGQGKVDLEKIREQIRRLENEQNLYLKEKNATRKLLKTPLTTTSSERERLQLRVRELLLQLQKQHQSSPTTSWSGKSEPVTPGSRQKPPSAPGSENPLRKSTASGFQGDFPKLKDPVSRVDYAESLFQKGDFEGALRAFRQVDLRPMAPEQRAPIHYLMASSYRNLGKMEEAKELYRQVIRSKGDPSFIQSAEWQLEMIEWQLRVKDEISRIRERSRRIRR